MLTKATAGSLTPELKRLMAFAMSEEKVEEEFFGYLEEAGRFLYLVENRAFIGIEMKQAYSCKVRHIAVSMSNRQRRIGARMIEEVIKLHGVQKIFAETDRDAVGFYRKTGFQIKSLGEKYPGRERFYYVKTLPVK